ncbi:hypothetical protein [Apis mellifera associated microvirus 39]|nr:hypothetical protein [Apis mellifera associated microvirus 39]
MSRSRPRPGTTQRQIRDLETSPFTIASDPLLGELDWTPTPPRSVRITPEIEDRRTWHPDSSYKPPRTLSGRKAAILLPPNTPKRTQRARIGSKAPLEFQAPRFVAVCIRRNQRREVLHALKKTGKGARSRKHRFNALSGVICRR